MVCGRGGQKTQHGIGTPSAARGEAIDVYADIISGADEHGGEQYRDLCDTITDEACGLVVVHELSWLSRLGAGGIHRFTQHCMGRETASVSPDIAS